MIRKAEYSMEMVVAGKGAASGVVLQSMTEVFGEEGNDKAPWEGGEMSSV